MPSADHETLHARAIEHIQWHEPFKAADVSRELEVAKEVIQATPAGISVAPITVEPLRPEFLWLARAAVIVLLLILASLWVRPAHGQFSHINTIQFNQSGSPISGGFFAYPFTINCGSGMTCNASGATINITSSGGASGCAPPGSMGLALYDTGTGCGDIADLSYDGSHTLTLGASGVLALAAGANVTGITAAMIPTLNQNTTGSAAKWTTARNLAGNSVDGSANVAFANKFIVQGTTDAGLSGAQFLGALGTGILKNTTTTGVLSIATGADIPACTLCVVASSPGVGIAHFAGSTQTVTSSAVDLSGADATGTMAAGRMPALTGDVTNSAGSLATTIAANAVTGAKMANATVTATQLAAQYSKGQCTELWGGSGTSFAMTSGDDAIANNGCYNDSGVTRTITAVKARSDNASNTTTVNPTFGSAGTGTTICSGALTAGSSYAYSSTCTVSNASWTTGTGIDPGMATVGNATSIALLIEYTF